MTNQTEHEERYRLLIEHSLDLVCELGRSGEERGNYLYVSPNYPQVLGYQPGELLGTNAFALVHPDDLAALVEKFRHDSNRAIFRYRHKDGSWRWLDCSGQVFRTESGEERCVIISRDITESRTRMDRVRESEANMAAAQRMMHVGSWQLDIVDPETLDSNRNRLHWSDEVFRIFGHEPGSIEVSNEVFFNAVHPEDREMVLAAVSAAIESRTQYSIDHRVVLPDGLVRVVHEQSQITYDEATGKPLRMFGIVQDITDRKQMETALHESQARWRSLVENLPDMVMTLEPDGTILFVNGTVRGCHRERVAGSNLDELIPEEQRAHVRGCLAHVFATGEPQHFEISKYEEGVVAWYNGRIGAIRNAGKIVAATLIVTDITMQKRVEESLRESETRFRQMAENIHEVFWMVDHRAESRERMLYVSPAYEKIWGHSCESLYADPASFLEAVHPEDRERIAVNSRALQEAGKYNEEYRIIRPDGSMRWIHDRAFPIHDETGAVYRVVGLAEDITERKQIESQFFQAQKMEAFGKLAGGVAHDFNNLLTVITGYNEIVLNAFNPNDPRRDCVEEIARAAERAASLTSQLLAFSRQQVLQPKVINVNSVIENLQRMLRRLIGEDIQLSTEPAEDLARVKADPGQLENVLMNLVVNARDAMPSGGTVTIRTENVAIPQGDPDITPGDYVMMSVADTGVGIPEHVIGQIFEPFFTTKPVGHGTGLGLATCYGIVKQSEGFISVESRVGEGSTFRIFLPVVHEEEEKQKSADSPMSALPKGTETIMVVEDEPNVRKLTVAALERLGYQVIEADNGEDAFKIVQAHPSLKLDMVITDVVMPQMGGRDLAQWIRLMYPGIKVIFTSGYPNHAFDDYGLLDEQSAFLAKPFAPKMLAVRVRELLDKK
ncbi:MAG TPA: PAS domain S-box protein [Chthoniobacteraceae bacterium]|nr:PAS domain S-box protein [Chthoniobacteraceae bacterium]